jgi:hypothetical protein
MNDNERQLVQASLLNSVVAHTALAIVGLCWLCSFVSLCVGRLC